MLMDKNKFVVKSQGKLLSSKKSFEILDEDGKVLATAKDTTGFFASLLGLATIQVRDAADDAVVFSVVRSGWPMTKDQVLDGKGEVVGRYKAKIFSLSGGFHMYDKDGKHLGEIKGKMLKAEYTFVTPDKGAEMGKVSRTWGGLAQALFTGNDTYGVQIDREFEADVRAKTLILGATIAIESIFKQKAEKSGGASFGGGE